MATHSSILAYEIPWTEKTGRLQFMWLQRVRHNLATKQQSITILCQFLLYIKVNQLYVCVCVCVCVCMCIYIYTHLPSLLDLPPIHPHPTHLSQHRAWTFPVIYSGSHQVLTVLLMVVYICQSRSPSLSHLLPLPSPISTHPFSVSTFLSYPANRYICTIFLHSPYMH